MSILRDQIKLPRSIPQTLEYAGAPELDHQTWTQRSKARTEIIAQSVARVIENRMPKRFSKVEALCTSRRRKLVHDQGGAAAKPSILKGMLPAVAAKTIVQITSLVETRGLQADQNPVS